MLKPAVLGVAAWKAGFSLAFAGVCLLYILLGLVEEGVLLLRRIGRRGDGEEEQGAEPGC